MSTSEKKIAANRRNGKKAPGPKDTSATRFNAVQHGLLAKGITELDDRKAYGEILRRLNQGDMEELNKFLRERMALLIVRLRRAPLLEAECITGALHPPTYDETQNPLSMTALRGPLVEPGQPARIREGDFNCLLKLQRYETGLENMFFRCVNSLERLQRMKQGERLPAPAAVDVTVHHERAEFDSDSGCSNHQVLEGVVSEPASEEAAAGGTVRVSDTRAVEETFSESSGNEDADAADDVTVQSPPARWDSLTESSDEQLPEDTDSESGNEEELDAER